MPDAVLAEQPALRERPTAASVLLDPALEQALERLLLSHQIRELADLPSPVPIEALPRVDGLVARLVRRVSRSGKPVARFVPGAWGVLRRVAVDAGMLVALRVWLVRGRVWRVARTTAGAMLRNAVFHRSRYHALPVAAMTGYVAAQQEDALIRVCLLLRTMKRYGACIEFLLRRLRSGLPAEHTREWLAFFLREIGDGETAARIQPAPAAQRLPVRDADPDAGNGVARRKLKFGLIMLAMFDTEVFRSCLRSLLASDFDGQIVIAEDGCQPEPACEAFCRERPVTYVKNPAWTGPSPTLNLGISRFDPETDVIIECHSDILWPAQWFGQLAQAWERVFDTGRVGLINLGYLQYHASIDPALNELFVRGRYDDLFWVLRTRRDLQPALDHVHDVQIADMSRAFGLGRDIWGDQPSALRRMVARYSVCGSFPLAAWRALGGFTPEMPFGFDLELQYQACRDRRWNLTLNNTPLIHLVSSDSRRLAGEARQRWQGLVEQTTTGFAKKWGWSYDHFCWTFFAETCVIHHDEIVRAANEGRFEEVDDIFDEFAARLAQKTLASCELVWCNSRATCPYTATA